MPKFEGTGEIEIIVTPKEFVKNCSTSELIRLKNLINDEFNLEVHISEEKYTPPRSYDQMKFNQALNILKDSWLILTKIDGDIIENIAKKYE